MPRHNAAPISNEAERKGAQSTGFLDSGSVYRIEWRVRATVDGSSVVNFTRSIDVTSATEAKQIILSRQQEAVHSEFRILMLDDVGRHRVVIHALDIAGWNTADHTLPVAVLPTSWGYERERTEARWRLFSIISNALDQAAQLRLAKRQAIREARSGCRRLLIEQTD